MFVAVYYSIASDMYGAISRKYVVRNALVGLTDAPVIRTAINLLSPLYNMGCYFYYLIQIKIEDWLIDCILCRYYTGTGLPHVPTMCWLYFEIQAE